MSSKVSMPLGLTCTFFCRYSKVIYVPSFCQTVRSDCISRRFQVILSAYFVGLFILMKRLFALGNTFVFEVADPCFMFVF